MSLGSRRVPACGRGLLAASFVLSSLLAPHAGAAQTVFGTAQTAPTATGSSTPTVMASPTDGASPTPATIGMAAESTPAARRTATPVETATPTPAATSTPLPTPTVTPTPTDPPSSTPTPTSLPLPSPLAPDALPATSGSSPAASGRREVRLADQAGDGAKTHLFGAAPRGGYVLELFDKGRPAANVRLVHQETGALLGFELPGAASARTVEGAVATARVRGATVRWTSFADRLKEDVVLSTRPAGDQVVFTLEQRGLTFAPDGAGGYLAQDASGAAPFHLQAPTVADAQGRPGMATLALDPERGAATIRLDPAFLAWAAYPISVDPTVDYGWITIDGPAVTMTISQAGDSGRLSFTGTAGQYVSLGLTGVTMGSWCCGVDVSLLKPDGTGLAATSVGTNGGDLDAGPLPTTGTYTILVTPGTNTGSLTLTLSSPLGGTLDPTGPAVTQALGRPGQDVRMSFSGAAGEQFSVGLTNVTLGSWCCGVHLYVLKPDGSELTHRELGTNGGDADVQLPIAGSYTVRVTAGVSTGSLTLTLSTPVTGTLSPTGPAVAVSLARAGQDARLTFEGTAGQWVSLGVTGSTLGSWCCGVYVDILRPDGTPVVATSELGTNGGDLDVQLPVTGTYTVRLNPGTNTGGATLTLSAPAGGSLTTTGPAVAATVDRPGQDVRVTFEGTAGQRVSVGMTVAGYSGGGAFPMYILKPDGGSLAWNFFCCAGGDLDPGPLPVSGTYTVRINPGLSTGSFTLTLSAPITGTLDPAGPSMTVATDRAGQDVRVTFGATAGQRVSVSLGVGSYAGGNSAFTMHILKPDDTPATWNYVCCDGGVLQTEALPVSGTYTVRINPGIYTGTFTLAFALPKEPASAGTQYNGAPSVATAGVGVNTYTGSFRHEPLDLAIAGRGPSPRFGRAYNSNDTRAGPLGPGWTHSYNARLSDPGDWTGDVLLVGPQGRSDRYSRNGDGSYTPPAGIATKLVKNGDGTYTATFTDLTTWTFSRGGLLTRITDRFGNQSLLSYTDGRLTTVRDPADRGSLTLGYDANGRLTSVSDWQTPAARVVRFEYDASGRLAKATDREGQVTTYCYQGATYIGATCSGGSGSRLEAIIDARGNRAVTNTFDAQGRVATQKDATGLLTGQQYAFCYKDTAPACNDGTKTTVTYPASTFDGSNPVFEDTYDSAGKILKRVSKPSSTETFTEQYGYDANGFRNAVMDPRGFASTPQYQTLFCYDANYAGVAVPGSRGNLTRIIAPPADGGNPLVTLFKYDGNNNLVQVVPPKGVSNGATVTCTTDLSASVNTLYATDHAYDATGAELLSTTRRYMDPDLGQQTAITKYEFGDGANPGRVTRVIPPRGNTGPTPDYSYATSFAFFGEADPSKRGMLQSVTDPLGNKTTYDYDAVGRRTKMVDPNGNAAGGVPSEHTWESVFDNEDRMRFAKAPAAAAGGAQLVTEARFDQVGNRTVAIDANGQVTRFVFDERNLLQEVQQSPSPWTDPNATPSPLIRTLQTHDNLGSLTRVVRASGDETYERATDYLFDGLNRLRKEIQYPSWPTTTPTLETTYAYDGNGNRIKEVRPGDQALDPQPERPITYGYDALNRLTSISYSNGATPNVSFGYDAHGNRTSMADGTGTTTYQYDELDRLLAVTSPGPRTVGYRYDRDGNRRKLIYPDGSAVTYGFDQAGRPEFVEDWATPARRTSYQYSPDGTLKQITNVNGTTATLSYDNAQRLKEVWNQQAGGGTLSRHVYTLDAAGNRTQMAETLAQVGGGTITPTTTYSYDRLYRLTGDGTNSYSYDPVGNRLTWGSASYSYDRADRITAAGATSYTVNANGDLTSRGSDSFGYDQANRLKTATVGGATTSYTWDGDGQRASSTTGGTTTSYVYDVGGELPLLLEDGARKYVHGLNGSPVYSVDNAGGTLQVSHADALGSVRALTDGSGALVQTYRTDPFGVPTATQGSSGQPFGFTGEQRDTETGLVYLRARMYDPQTGRFLQRDPVAKGAPGSQGWHRFAYAGNNPVKVTDPSGDVPIVVPIAFGIALSPEALAFGAAVTATVATVGTAAVALYDHRDEIGAAIGGFIYEVREGKPFTRAGKREIRERNAEQHGGVNVCEYCGVETADPQKSEKGVTPPPNEGAVDHFLPQSKGGAGDPDNGVWTCRQCNGDKGDYNPLDP